MKSHRPPTGASEEGGRSQLSDSTHQSLLDTLVMLLFVSDVTASGAGVLKTIGQRRDFCFFEPLLLEASPKNTEQQSPPADPNYKEHLKLGYLQLWVKHYGGLWKGYAAPASIWLRTPAGQCGSLAGWGASAACSLLHERLQCWLRYRCCGEAECVEI